MGPVALVADCLSCSCDRHRAASAEPKSLVVRNTFLVVAALATWVLIHLSSTVIRVERDSDGTRWLIAGSAQLPSDVVSRSLAIPKSAKRNAMGPQLDPAAFLVTHSWVPHLVMLVLDDDDDPTPYWLVSAKKPRAILEAFVPDQAAQATSPMGD